MPVVVNLENQISRATSSWKEAMLMICGNFLKSGIVAVWMIIQDSIDIEIEVD